MKIGYARVSTTDQNLDLQSNALTEYGCTTIYKEKISGKNTDRPELKNFWKVFGKVIRLSSGNWIALAVLLETW
jgi:DNA invertase Pin-like site-specific DNA recombinase